MHFGLWIFLLRIGSDHHFFHQFGSGRVRDHPSDRFGSTTSVRFAPSIVSWFVPPSTTKHQSSDRVGAFFMPWFGSLSSSLGSWSSSSRFVTVTSGRIGVHHRFGSDPCLSLVMVRIGVLHCTLDRFGSFSSWRGLLRYSDPVRFVVKRNGRFGSVGAIRSDFLH